MKNKKYLISIIAIAVISLSVFIIKPLFFSNELSESILGVWKVVGNVNDGVFEYEDEQFYTFDREKCVLYEKESNVEKYYKLKKDELSMANCKYTIDVRSENYMRLYKNNEQYMLLVRNYDFTEKINDIKELLIGKWEVVSNMSDNVETKVFEFTEDSVMFYGNLSTTPSISVKYEINDNYVIVKDLNSKYVVRATSKDYVVVIDQTGMVFEIKRIE